MATSLLTDAKNLKLQHPLTPARQAILDRLKAEKKLIGLYRMRDTFVSRLCIGGKIRNLGFFPYAYEAKTTELAIRLTDVATLYFWKYRIRSKTDEPGEDNLNLGLASAKFDLENESELGQYVVDLKYDLERQGLLPDAAEIAKWKESKLLSRRNNLQRTAQIHTTVQELFKQNVEMALRIKDIEIAFGTINHNMSVVAEALNKLIRDK